MDTGRLDGHTVHGPMRTSPMAVNHPYVPPSLRANTSENIPVAISAAPTKSIGSRAAPGRRGGGAMNRKAPTIASGAMITLIPNDHRHDTSVVRNPPTSGPRPAADPAIAPHAANAAARSRPWKLVDSSDSVAGSIIEAPMPSITASPRMRLPTFHERAASSEPVAKIPAPMMNMRRLP